MSARSAGSPTAERTPRWRFARPGLRRAGTATLRLTRSGSRMAARLAERLRLRVQEIATDQGWRGHCVRRLVKRVCRKLGMSGQVALVRQVRAAGAVARRRGAVGSRAFSSHAA